MFRRKLPTVWFTRKLICLLLLSLTISVIGWRSQAERWLFNTKAASRAIVTAKANERQITASPTILLAGAKYSGLTVLHVSTEQALRDALTATNGAQNGDSVVFDANITLSRDLPAVQNSITINGNGHFLDGAGAHRGLFVYAGAVAIQNLAIQNAVAQGGAGAGGGSGAGLGGALFVNTGASVTISGVSFNGNAAKGGSDSSNSVSGGGGGGLGGDGGRGGGGVGAEADGGITSGSAPGAGIVTGAAGGGGADVGQSGGADGGGGAANTNGNGGGGGVAGGSAVGSVNGGAGGFGGGGGGRGGAGGFGGGGGSGDSVNSGLGGAGGFGGGGGGGAQGIIGGGGFGAGLGGANSAGYTEISACTQRCAPPPPPGGGGGSIINASIGGGGLGAGGAVFVRDGGTLFISGTLTEAGSTVMAGQSYRPAGSVGGGPPPPANPCDCPAIAYRKVGSLGFDGSAFGSGLFLQGNGTVSFSPGQGESQTLSNVIADQTGSGGTNGNAGSWGLSKSGAGTLSLNAANTYTGVTTLNAGTLILGTATSTGTGAITFAAGQTATLQVNASSAPTNTIKGFALGHTIDLAAAGLATNASLGANNVLTITGGTVSPITLNLDPAQNFSPYVFKLTTDNNGGTALTLFTACPTITLGALPQAMAGMPLNSVLQASPAGGNYQFSSGNLPAWLSLAANGTLSGTPPATGTFNFTVSVTGFVACQQSIPLSVTVVCPAVTLTPASLPNAEGGTPYNQQLTASPVSGNEVFNLTSGALPQGLTLSPTGLLGGTTTQTGNFNFRVAVTGFGGQCGAFRDYQLVVSGCAPVTLSPANLSNGTIGAAYSQTVSATPAGSYGFSVSSGALPLGLTLNAVTGAITGSPTGAGSFNFRITAANGACSGGRDYTVTITCATITAGTLPNTTAGNTYNQTVSVTPSGSYTFSVVQGNLPSGLSLNPATGAVSGTPVVAGNHNFTIKAQTASGCSGQQTYSLAVACPSISLPALATPTLNSLYNQTVSALPAGGSYSFAVTAGVLPTGLSLNPATGAISGTPTTTGSYNFTLTATGFGSCAGSRAYTGTIGGSSCPTITLPDLPSGQPGQLYNQSVAASPTGSYSYAVTSGSLPPGLTLYGSLGMVFGYPTTAGTFNLTITATGSNNCTGSKTYSLVIGGAALRSLVFGDFDGDGKADPSVWCGTSGNWLMINSGDGQLKTETWGSSASPYFDVMTPGDYDGDGRMDLAVFRRSTGQWLIKGSRDGAVTAKVWGLATDVPVPGDYDGDGKTDLAVWRGAESNWYILRSSDQQPESISWGTSRAPYRDVPVSADYDGDGKTDMAVFRQANGHWYIRLSSDGQMVDKHWGLGTDVPVPADYDGDGKADIAVWRGSDTNWYIVRSSDGAVNLVSCGTSALGDVPAPGDYDGDGKADVAVWRASSGMWLVKNSRDGLVMTIANGQPGDAPVIAKP
ncbi:MAG: putative Ig domain-containing protein [Acidobacteriota bacterium]